MARRKKKSGSKKKTTRKKTKRATPQAAPKKTRRSGSKRKAKTSGKRRAYKYKPRYKKNATHRNWRPVRQHRRRTNPTEALVTAGLAAGAGILAYLVVLAGTYYATKDQAQQSRNRKIIAGVVIVGSALVIAKKRPLIAAGLAAGGALAGFGDYLALKLVQYLPQKPQPTQAAVFEENMRGLRQLGAVFEENMAGLQQMGDAVPAAPWTQPGPFG